VSRNRLSSLEGLAEGFKVLHELYVHDNKLTSLVGLATRATMLETLVSHACQQGALLVDTIVK
jgi:hypothetical protein